MDTLMPTSTARHTTIRIVTERPTQFVDLTELIEALVAQTDIHLGFLNVQTLHTTTAIVINEHEPMLLVDIADLLDRIAPAGASYRHDDAFARTANIIPDERLNGHAHCRAFMLGSSAGINIVDGRLQLGRWQRVFLVELDGPREREVSVLILGVSR